MRDILGDCDGLVRWGGDDAVPREGRFRLAVGPSDPRLDRLGRSLGATPPGRPVDLLDPVRRARALDTRAPAARALDARALDAGR